MRATALTLLLAVCFVSPSPADDGLSWDEAIAAVRERSAQMTERADELGEEVFLGTIANELDIPWHRCSILGRMLGYTDHVGHLEPEYPDPDSDTGNGYRYAARSLDNWVRVAEYLLSQPTDRRVRIWNLECAGHHEIPAYLYHGESEETFYDVIDNGLVLRILGDVESGFADQMISALDSNPSVRAVALGSQGGSVAEAIAAGSEIRRRGLETTVWANCYSACPLVLLGGARRTMWSPYSDIGFHQLSTPDGALEPDSAWYGVLGEYIEAMGANPRTVLAYIFAAEPDEIFIPPIGELCDAGVTTWIQRICMQ